jgi:hypothetical protein
MRKTHQKVAPQPKSHEVLYRRTSTTTGSNPGEKKNSKALMTGGHKNSTDSNQGGAKNLPYPRRVRRKHHRRTEAWNLPTLNT